MRIYDILDDADWSDIGNLRTREGGAFVRSGGKGRVAIGTNVPQVLWL